MTISRRTLLAYVPLALGPSKAFAINRSAVFLQHNGDADQTAMVVAAHNEALSNGRELRFGPGIFNIRGWLNTPAAPVRWLGSSETVINVSKRSLEFSSKPIMLNLLKDAIAGSRVLGVAHSMLSKGSIIYIEANALTDFVRSEKIICQSVKVEYVGSSEIVIDRPLNFSFKLSDAGIKIYLFTNIPSIEINSICFSTESDNLHRRALTLSGLDNRSNLSDCAFSQPYKDNPNNAPDGVMIQQSVGTIVSRLVFFGCRYGLTISRGSREVSATNITAKFCRHAINPAYWTYSCEFVGIVGSNNLGTIDCHSSFDIKYVNVVSQDELAASNMRSCGGILQNARISFHKDARFRTILLSYQKFNDRVFRASRSLLLKDVVVDFGNMAKDNPGFFIGGSGDIIFDNVKTSPSSISVGRAAFSNAKPIFKETALVFRPDLERFSS